MKAFVYILSNKNNSNLYTGVTRDLQGRLYQRKTRKHPYSFTARHNVDKLVHFEGFNSMGDAIM